jgi:drug/metabolite transporter (DMT)-like permease
MEWLPLTLLCAFSLASADALSKSLTDYTAQELVVVRFGASAVILSPLLMVYPVPSIAPAFWGWIAVLLPLEIAAMQLYMRAIQDSSLAVTLPYLAFTPVFVVATGYLILGEQVTWTGLGGICLVVSGAWLLNLRTSGIGNGPWRWWMPLRAIIQERGSRLMLAVALIYSMTSAMGKAALQHVTVAFFGPFYFCLLGATTLIIFSLARPRTITVLWRRPGRNLLLGALMAVMIISHFAALQQVEVAYMIAVKRTSMLFGILYGALLFREARLGWNLLAGSIMVSGVALIAL